MSVRRSSDEAATWGRPLLLDSGDSAYSCLVPEPLLQPLSQLSLVEAADRKEEYKEGGKRGSEGGYLVGSEEGGLLYEARNFTIRFVRFPLDL